MIETLDYLPLIGTVTVIAVGMAISPGLDFALVSRNSMVYSRRAGMLSSLGISLAVWIHVAYSVTGVAMLVTRFPSAYTVLRFVGATYLIYLGLDSLIAANSRPAGTDRKDQAVRDGSAFRSGFLCNALNPKTTLFFLSIFTQVISPSTPLLIQLLCGLIISLAHLLWFASVAFWMSTPRLLNHIWQFKPWIERCMGVVLCALALHILVG